MSSLIIPNGYQSTLKGLGSPFLVYRVIHSLRMAYLAEKVTGNELNLGIFKKVINKVEKEEFLDSKDVEIISFEMRCRGISAEEIHAIETHLFGSLTSNYASKTTSEVFSELGT